MRHRPFARLVEHVVMSVSAAGVAGCGGLDTEGIEPIACVEESPEERSVGSLQPDWLGAITPVQALDAIEMWATWDALAGAQGSTRADVTIARARGELCATATDRAACDAKVAAITVTSDGFTFGDCGQVACRGFMIVGTRGDEVVVLDDDAGVRAWLGDIDTPVEAAWATQIAGYDVGCGDRPAAGTSDERWGVRPAAGAYDVLALDHISDCDPYQTDQVLLRVSQAGAVDVLDSETVVSEEDLCAVAGRRPAGWLACARRADTSVGSHLARIAELEGASITAFGDLTRELSHHRAPRSLVRASRRARGDEVRHALATRKLAKRFGGSASARRSTQVSAPRDLLAIALDNAREGCAREAYGAVVARWQSLHARDVAVRAAFGRIARDEAKHAALSLRLARWLARRLPEPARAEVDAARREAFAVLRREVTAPVDVALVTIVGLPPAPAARALLDQLVAQLTPRSASAR